jgi:hypothetical protein
MGGYYQVKFPLSFQTNPGILRMLRFSLNLKGEGHFEGKALRRGHGLLGP